LSNPIRQLLEQTSPDTLVKTLMINGKTVKDVQKFAKFDSLTGLAYFKQKSNSTFVVIVEKIDKLEFNIPVIKTETQTKTETGTE
jgi:hypothetical protein